MTGTGVTSAKTPLDEFSVPDRLGVHLTGRTFTHYGDSITVRPLTETDAHAFPAAPAQGPARNIRKPSHRPTSGKSHTPWNLLPNDFAVPRDRQNNFTLGAFRMRRSCWEWSGSTGRRGEKEEHRGHIWGMYVRSDEQGKGFGKALLADAVSNDAEVTYRTWNRLSSASSLATGQARNLYASLGFASCGIDPRALYVGGEYLDEERMVLILD